MKDEEIDWLSIICQILVVIILFQIIWLVNKNVYQTDDCFWKSCVVIVESK